jgi:glycine/D-amino acid oxidase-like deaminating enzyme
VAVFERFKMAHGATGHNAGQVTSYFERGFAGLVREFGLAMAAAGQKATEDAWTLLDEMYTQAGLTIPLNRFEGHAGLSGENRVLAHLENNRLRREAGLALERLRVADTAPFLPGMPEEYAGLYEVVPREEVLAALETVSGDYVAVVSSQKGCVNSALLCQEVLAYLNRAYPERFALYEHAPVGKIILRGGDALLDAHKHAIAAKRVVLCTNGFEDFTIINENGLELDGRFHANVRGNVGYMSGYIEKLNKPPMAMSYYSTDSAASLDPYFYLTRRPYEYEKGARHNLVSVGGPEVRLGEDVPYARESDLPDERLVEIDEFLRKTYDLDPNRTIEYAFTWHGLMGYTKNGVRMVGPEPQNPVLLYNLGCNGVGILPSALGGRIIARHLAGESVERSIFDVPAR